MIRTSVLFLGLITLLLGCEPSTSADPYANPPAEGFRAEQSDPRAIALADSVMEAMGGRRAWDQTRYLGWNFMGRRYLVWDKQADRARIDVPRDSTVYLLDLADRTGRVFIGGSEVTAPKLRDSLVSRGISIWINDSYWLIMPYKLKDSGVALAYEGKGMTSSGQEAEMVALTFEDVGDTPDNKYRVYIDPSTHLVTQWDYYRDRQDSLPRISTPWLEYQRKDGILLSGNRGQAQLTDIMVWEELPDRVFDEAEKPEDILP